LGEFSNFAILFNSIVDLSTCGLGSHVVNDIFSGSVQKSKILHNLYLLAHPCGFIV